MASHVLLSMHKHGTGKGYVSGCQGCKVVNRIRSEEYTKRHPRKASETRIKLKRRVNAIKMDSGCVDCGYAENPVALDFDHVRGEKMMAISGMVGRLRSWVSIEREIVKCEVVCANCHRIRTWSN